MKDIGCFQSETAYVFLPPVLRRGTEKPACTFCAGRFDLCDLPPQPHRADSMGMICFFRLMTFGRNTGFFSPVILKA